MPEQHTIEGLTELVEQKQYRALKTALGEMNEVDIAEFLGELDPEKLVLVFRLLPNPIFQRTAVPDTPGDHQGKSCQVCRSDGPFLRQRMIPAQEKAPRI